MPHVPLIRYVNGELYIWEGAAQTTSARINLLRVSCPACRIAWRKKGMAAQLCRRHRRNPLASIPESR